MSTAADVVNGVISITSGKSARDARLVKLKVSCDMDDEVDYGVPPALFNTRASSISVLFSNTLRLDVQLDFKLDDTASREVNVNKFGNWISSMVRKMRALDFGFPCEVYVAVTDVTHLYQDTNDDLVALGEEADGSDDPTFVIMSHRGRLVQVGQTG